jgi:hypothetical protein
LGLTALTQQMMQPHVLMMQHDVLMIQQHMLMMNLEQVKETS